MSITVDVPCARITLPSVSEASRDGYVGSKWLDIKQAIGGYGIAIKTWHGEGVWCLASSDRYNDCLVYLPGRAWISDLCRDGYTVHAIIERDADGVLHLVPYTGEAEE